MRDEGESAWLIWWNLGILAGLVGIPAMLGFLVGARIEASTATAAPWRLILALVGFALGAFVSWLAFMARRRT